MTDNPLLVRAIFLAAGADPTKLQRWMDDNIPDANTEHTSQAEGFTPHAA